MFSLISNFNVMTPPRGLRDKHECNFTDEHFTTHSAHKMTRRFCLFS